MIRPGGRPRPGRSRGGPREAILLVGVLVVNLAAVTIQVRRDRAVPVLEAAAHVGVLGQETIRSAGRGAGSLFEGFRDMRFLARENDELRRRLARAEWELTVQRGLTHRARGFTELDAEAFDLGEPLPAEVIGFSSSPAEGRLAVNRGARHGVEAGAVVMSAAGLVGRVVSVGSSASSLEPLTHPATTVAVVTAEHRTHGLLRADEGGGAAGPSLRLDYVPAGRDVGLGEEVITSGLDGLYPKGLVVGVVRVIRDSGVMLQDIRIDAAVEFDALERVFLLPFRPTARPDAGASPSDPIPPPEAFPPES